MADWTKMDVPFLSITRPILVFVSKRQYFLLLSLKCDPLNHVLIFKYSVSPKYFLGFLSRQTQ